ncbi:hypothetical protein [Marinobacter sp. CA1]|uniref:hypothetical protein n=1 Tax=Marinobacter sp. CA1 TaxID=2817656 RepID=UPI001D08422F|nr:hypothetical protein [Marinobacter sp. CA1]UDL05462.1 hypothetical protein J2887_01415 [Marinobacter sp. CA1]
MKTDIKKVWRALRPTVKDGFTFNETKDVVAAAALPVEELAHLQQKSLPAKGASKGELLDALDGLISKEPNPDKAIQYLIAAMLEQKSHLEARISDCAQRFGWKLVDGQLRPLDFQVDDAVQDFSAEVKGLLRTAYRRFGEGDYSGAMTAICSGLDTVTNYLYTVHDLGNPHDDSYQQRVSRSFAVLEPVYRDRFGQMTDDGNEVNRLWQNYRGAINQAAYVMGSFRRNASDVHGVSACPPELIRHAIDSGTFIIRSITSETSGNVQQDDALDF